MTSKAQRQNRIVQLIQSDQISSQEQLTKLLEAEGIISTQATISRDLDEIGALKVNMAEGKSVYAIAEIAKRPGAQGTLSKNLKQFVLSVEAVSPLIVIKTSVGCAQVVCAAIDYVGMVEIAGTIAGDDTIFIATKSDVDVNDFAKRLSDMGELNAV